MKCFSILGIIRSHRFFMGLMFFGISSSSVFAQSNYSIKGNIVTDKPVSWAYLYAFNPARTLLDSVEVKDGQFAFQGQLENSVQASIRVKGWRRSQEIYLEPKGKYTVKMYEGWGEPNSVIGGVENAILKAYESETKVLLDSMRILGGLYEKGTEAQRIELSVGMNKLNKEWDEIKLRYIESYPASLALLNIMQPQFEVMNYGQLEQMLALFSKDLVYAPNYQGLLSKHALKKSQQLIGNFAPAVVSTTADGKPFKLESLRGKLVLLDFWASWCTPCRVGNRALKPIYEKYKDSGFEMVSFSMDDKSKLWHDAIKADDIPWIQVSDLKSIGDSEVAKKYFVKSLPTIFLIDEAGKVMAQNISKEELEVILKERFKK